MANPLPRPAAVAATPGVRARLAAVAAAAVAASMLTAGATVPGDTPASRLGPAVVVTGTEGVAAVADAVRAVGGTVRARLPLAGGVVARLPEGAVPVGTVVTPDRELRVAADGADATGAVSTVRETLGLPADGNEGAGATVALVDTGVADVPDLADAVVAHVDVSGTGPGDGYGHGTAMAGIIAGSGESSDGAYRGVAPGAHVLDVKVADADGTTSLTHVLRGLEVVGRRGNAYGVDVLNLSLSSGSPLPYQVDPLNQALAALWHRGVTVVTPAGNDGPEAGSVTSPGNDPRLLTAGALDEAGTGVRGDDTVADFSGRGPTRQGAAKPDLAAPGTKIVSVKSPGSVLDDSHPAAHVGDAYLRGSGTSQAAAVTSGAAAALLASRASLRPDHVKAVLTRTAYEADGLAEPSAAGSGGLDLAAALDAADRVRPGHGNGGHDDTAPPPGDGDAWGALLDAFEARDRAAALAAWRALSPQARSWGARSWGARSWGAGDWVARSWGARSWGGRTWSGADGSEEEWLMRLWAARTWAARSWGARSWGGEDWSARSWGARSWGARSWGARSWGARSWGARSWGARSWGVDDWEARSWGARSWGARSWGARSWGSGSWEARSWGARSWGARSWGGEDWEARSWGARSWGGEDWEARSWGARSWGSDVWVGHWG